LKISFLGASQEVGRSAFLLDTGELKLLLDSGSKPAQSGEDNVVPLDSGAAPDAIVLSHAHFDHSGSLPMHFLKGNPLVYATPPSIPLAQLILDDSLKVMKARGSKQLYSQQEMHALVKNFVPTAFEQEVELFDGTKFSLHDAGHIMGSSQVLVQAKGKKILYCGDFKGEATRLQEPVKHPGECNVLFLESTYASKDHPKRVDLEKDFLREVSACLDEESTAIIPSFAIGRTQEMLLVLRDLGEQVFVDGLGQQATVLHSEFTSYLRNPKAFQEAVKNSHFVEVQERKHIGSKKPALILSTAGMLEGGPALNYIKRFEKTGNAGIFITGYQVEGTNGRRLLDKSELVFGSNSKPEKITLPVKFFDFSAHAGRSELIEYAKKANPEKIYCIHGEKENCELLAKDLRGLGFDAVAPGVGAIETIN
jgi:putative mRNA 3-end processing factor